MPKILLLTALIFAGTAHAADPFKLDCKVTSTKSEVDDLSLQDDLYEYLRSILDAKTAKINVDGEYVVMKLFDKNDDAVDFIETKYDGTTAKTKIKKTNSLAMKQYVSKGYKKRGEVAFYNDNAAPLDNSFGAYFHLVFKKADLERGTGTMDVRIWTASVSEPNDDTGEQSLGENSNVFMSCKAL